MSLNQQFEADLAAIDPGQEIAPDYNVAPTKMAPLIIAGRSVGSGGPARELTTAKWGLIPHWAKDPNIGSRLINARAETLTEKPAFRNAFAKRRAIVPADGYYEWYHPAAAQCRQAPDRESATKPRKQPFFIRPEDGSALAMAGLYEFWKQPDTADASGAWVASFAIITTSAEDSLGHIHDRMPLMVAPQHYDDWLTVGASAADLDEMLTPASPDRLDAYPVSFAVNNVRNNGAELIDPIALAH